MLCIDRHRDSTLRTGDQPVPRRLEKGMGMSLARKALENLKFTSCRYDHFFGKVMKSGHRIWKLMSAAHV